MRQVFFSVSVLFAIFAISCSDQFGEVKQLAPDENIYPGIYDTIFASIGINRVELDFMKNGRNAPLRLSRATKTVVTWDDQIRIFPLSTWVNIPELTESKIYRFTVYTEDDHGNRSVPLEIGAMPYNLSNLETLNIPDPRVTNTQEGGILVSWPQSMVGTLFEYRGGEYDYNDRDGNPFNDEFDGFSFAVNNFEEGDRVNITMTHRIIPRVSRVDIQDNGDPLTSILDEVKIDRNITFIVPHQSIKIDIVPMAIRTTKGANWIEFDFGGAYDIESFMIRPQAGTNNTEGAPLQNFRVEFWKFENVGSPASTTRTTSPWGEWRTMAEITNNNDPELFEQISVAFETNDNGYWTNRVRFVATNDVAVFDWDFPIGIFILEPDVSPQRPTNDAIRDAANVAFLNANIPKAWWYPPYLRTNVALYRHAIASSIRSDTAWDGIGHEGPSNAVDGLRGILNASRWVSHNPSPGGSYLAVEWDLDMPIMIDGMSFWIGQAGYTSGPRLNATFSIRDKDGEWIDQYEYNDSRGYNIYFADFDPIEATGARVRFSDSVYARMFQFEAYTTVRVPGY